MALMVINKIWIELKEEDNQDDEEDDTDEEWED